MTKRIPEHETLCRSILMFVKILAFFGLSSCGIFSRSEKPNKKAEELKVLFIGNSYSFDAPKMFRNIAKKNGEKVKIASCTHGGWTLQMHSKHDPTLKKLRGKPWDIVVIQDFSMHGAYPEIRRQAEMYPFVKFFADEARAIGARPMLYQTWGRRGGQPGLKGDNFYQMNARIREGYSRASEYAGGIDILPVGDAWEDEYRKGNGSRLFVEDGSHPSEFGNRVSALVFFETIFGYEAEFTK
ncbi:MAG: hypothetical protein V4727_03190 [Verrucomicrobiota bacterium]